MQREKRKYFTCKYFRKKKLLLIFPGVQIKTYSTDLLQNKNEVIMGKVKSDQFYA